MNGKVFGMLREIFFKNPPEPPEAKHKEQNSVKKSDFYYDLPETLIAQHPIEPRDASRLMVCHPGGSLEHRHFFDLPEYLRPGDALVVNHTRVLPARLIGRREDTGGRMEFLLLKRLDQNRWEVLVQPGRRAQNGIWFEFGEGALRAVIEGDAPGGGRTVRFVYEGVFEQVLDRLGQMPLPPYIHERLEDPARYQTVYAKVDGSAAAPTAGLHFTPQLLSRIQDRGVLVAPVLLHVGLGTFRPVKEEDVEQHPMHEEYYEVEPHIADQLNAVREAGGRIISVGTTSCRVLETVADEQTGQILPGRGYTNKFILPGYRFRAVDALVTNFHLPESTLLMLVSALMGRERALAAYRTAVKERYRFFSFGDAMAVFTNR